MKKLSSINESVWADIHRRSNTGAIRKEDKWFEDKVMVFVERHKLKPDEYTINGNDLTVDIHKNIAIKIEDLVDGKLPFKFGKIDGTIWMHDLNLTTLENSPKEITGDFVIYQNRFKDFIGGPEIVGGDFAANMNFHLKTLDGSPKKVGGKYSIIHCMGVNDITGISPEIDGDLEITKDSNQPGRKNFTDEEYRKLSNINGHIIRK